MYQNCTHPGTNVAHHPKRDRHPCFSFIPATLLSALTRMRSSIGAAGAQSGLTATSTESESDSPPRLGTGNKRNAKRVCGRCFRSREAAPAVMTIADAVDVFMADEQGRSLSKETTKQSKTLFEKQFLLWAKHRGLNRLRDLTSAELVNFRATWKNHGL